MNHQPVNRADRNMGCAIILLLGVACFALGFGIVFGIACWIAPVQETAPIPPEPSPIIKELQAEIEAREAELDELVNTLNGAIAERNEAVELLRSLGHLRSL